MLERDLEQEERAGIRIQGLLAMIDEASYGGEPRLDVLGEIISSGRERFRSDVRVQIISLNAKDQVVGVLSLSVSQGDVGYEAFEDGTALQGLPARIKIVVSAPGASYRGPMLSASLLASGPITVARMAGV